MRAMAPIAATDGEQQHGVGLGEARLDAEQDRTRHHQRSNKRGATCNEGKRGPIGQKDSADRTGQRRQTIEPDGRSCVRNAECLPGFHRAGLQPVDTDRLLVADLVLKTDVDIFMRFQHLFGGLREARFVAVDRRYLEKTREERRAARIK